jgi:hypothetical protein
MLTVDIGKLPSEIATMFMARNPDSAPLRWHAHPNRRGKNTLDEIDDEHLFGDVPIVNDTMASAVRALLYAWNGWPEDAKMYAQPAPLSDRLYIIAVCERMIGRTEAAAELFAQLPQHPILPQLVSCVLEMTAATSHPIIQNFRQELQQDQSWDQLAFMELLDQARAERLGLAGEQLVSLLQCKEFELLFCHCYQGATGVQLAILKQEDPPPAQRRVRKQETKRTGSPCRRRSSSPAVGARALTVAEPRTKREPPARAAAQPEPAFRIACPECDTMIMLPSHIRGSRTKCTRCGAVFVAAQKQSPPPSHAAADRSRSSSAVWICCPLCGSMHTLPPSARGTHQQCTKCRTVFSVPT